MNLSFLIFELVDMQEVMKEVTISKPKATSSKKVETSKSERSFEMKDGNEKLSEIAKHSDTLRELNLIEVNDRDTTENDSFSKTNYVISRMYYLVHIYSNK